MNDLINSSEQLFYGLVVIAGVIILSIGIFRGVKFHWKNGHGKALAAFGGAVVLAVVLKNIVGITNWGDEKFHQIPSIGHGTGSVGRHW